MNKHVSTLLQKEVSRKEFLALSGVAIASIFGFGTLVQLLTGKSLGRAGLPQEGYGSSTYGGRGLKGESGL